MTGSRLVGTVVVAGAMLLAGCGDVADEAEADPPTTEAAATPTTSNAPTTTAPETLETGEGTMTDNLDSPVPGAGGNVVLAYPGETYPTELAGIVGLAVADLADRLGVDQLSISVVSVEEVTWTDASLGCPDPDMSYAQVLTDGLRTLLESDGVVYDYRSGGMTDPFLCEPRAAGVATTPGTFELTDEGEIIYVPKPEKDGDVPTEGINPPDE